MSNYKDMLTGTLKTVVGKVMEVAESDSVKNVMGKVKEAAENSGVREIYEPVAGKAKAYGNIAKLSLELNGESEELRRVFTEIGKLCYEQNKEAPSGFFAPLFAQVEQIQTSISLKQDEIAALKSELAPTAQSDIDVEIAEFEEVVDDTSADGAGAEVTDIPGDENI